MIQHVLPERHHRASSCERIRYVAEMMQKIFAGRVIDLETAVCDPSAGWQHESRHGRTSGARDLDASCIQSNRNPPNRLVIAENDFHPLGPETAALRYWIVLFEGE